MYISHHAAVVTITRFCAAPFLNSTPVHLSAPTSGLCDNYKVMTSTSITASGTVLCMIDGQASRGAVQLNQDTVEEVHNNLPSSLGSTALS
jgi:hypothetical protein